MTVESRRWQETAVAASVDGPDVQAGLTIADAVGAEVRTGSAVDAVTVLDALATGDLTIARVIEPHLDALAIHSEAGLAQPSGRWGVFAAEAPGARLTATATDGTWTLSGEKPWCSLADRLDSALVTAHVSDGRRLFAVDLHAPGVVVADVRWVARGLAEVTSPPVRFDRVPAYPVGETGWYLSRPGFAWGAIRVAACWLGGTRALLDSLRTDLAGRADPGEIRLYNLGSTDAAVWAADLAVTHAARAIDDGVADGAAGDLLAGRVRAVVAAAAETVLLHSAHARGPAPLAFDEAHARRVADLELYVRQHHAERDLATLGRMTLPA